MEKNAEVAEFVATLFHSGTITHFQHLQTREYATHKALGKFYPKIVDLADQLAESYQGRYNTRMKKFPGPFSSKPSSTFSATAGIRQPPKQNRCYAHTSSPNQ
jgi:hypothetical protein